jgi:hypothetical protein
LPSHPESCRCDTCAEKPVDKRGAVAIAMGMLAVSVEECRRAGAPLDADARRAFIARVWGVLEEGGFSPDEARALVRDLREG